ncbi:holo-ACP synthase [Streptococcus pluranimalium]|uniref:holo-ACP synthase n=1 Tax=Streptococcus pluranimalium TaxID=82348 RepID=UPI002A7D0CB6|nr:holo-ACP synthase [Streptococcus pluranimalium]
MIVGHGIDLQDISAIERAYHKKNSFAQRVLTSKEIAIFHSLKGKRQVEFLAGRWSAKEAFSKAYGTGIGKISFQDIEILSDQLGKPYFNRSPFKGCSHLSISHSSGFVQASVILENTTPLMSGERLEESNDF